MCFTDTMAKEISEASLKTLYTYNFSRFVKWPEPKLQTDHFIICTYPENPFNDTLYQLETQIIQNKPILIKELSTLKGISACQTLFIHQVSDAKLTEIIAFAKQYSILTISDSSHFAKKGGMIEMYVENNKIRFHINYYSSHTSSLTINAKLLQLASTIITTAIEDE